MIELIAAGQGGLGKSTLTAALARATALAGKKVVAVDACAGLRDLDFHFQAENKVVYDWQDVLDGTCTLNQALLPVANNVQLLASSQLQTWQEENRKRFERILDKLSHEADTVFVDAPGALSPVMLPLFHASARLLLLTAPFDSSIRKSEALLQRFRENGGTQAGLIVARIQEREVTQGLLYTPEVVSQVLDIPLLGVVPVLPQVEQALIKGEEAQDACYTAIAHRLMGEDVPLPKYTVGKKSLLRRLLKGRSDAL